MMFPRGGAGVQRIPLDPGTGLGAGMFGFIGRMKKPPVRGALECGVRLGLRQAAWLYESSVPLLLALSWKE